MLGLGVLLKHAKNGLVTSTPIVTFIRKFKKLRVALLLFYHYLSPRLTLTAVNLIV